MAQSETERSLPQRKGPLYAFDEVNMRWHAIGESVEEINELPEETLGQLAGDYIAVAIDYFANEDTDGYLRERAAGAKQAIVEGRVVMFYANDPKLFAKEVYGISREAVEKYPDGEPLLLFISQGAGILLPPQFMLTARRNPIEALATTANICSQINDFADGRSPSDPWTNMGAMATEAHFLKRAVRQHPDVALRPYYRELLETFPNGIFSLPTWVNQKAFPRVRLDKIRNN